MFARIIRRTRRLTWPEFFEARYGKVAATFAAISDVISGAIWLGGLLFTFGVLLQSLAGVPLQIGIIGGTVVVATYTMIGGMWAVAMTDFVQMSVFVVGLFILLFVVLADAGGWFTPLSLMLLAPSAFFLLGGLVWGIDKERHTVLIIRAGFRVVRELLWCFVSEDE